MLANLVAQQPLPTIVPLVEPQGLKLIEIVRQFSIDKLKSMMLKYSKVKQMMAQLGLSTGLIIS